MDLGERVWAQRRTALSESQESAARAVAGPKHEARAVQLRDDFDPSLLPFVLPDPPRSSRWSSNGRQAETVAALRYKAMPEAYTSPVTAHTPVLWYLEAQRARARAAGVDLDAITAAGPSPYPDFHSTGYQGPAAPVSSADLFIDETDWDGILAWFAAYCNEIARVEAGYQFRMNRLPGGQDGWTVKADRTKAAYRHLVWKLSATQESRPELRQLSVAELQTRAAEAGASCRQMKQGATHGEQKAALIDVLLAPTMVQEQLPDSNTTMKVFDVYKDALHAGIDDKEIVSMIALFGIQSNATMELDTVLLPNYKAGWEHLEVLQEAWRKKREDFGDFPRATAARRAPHHRPSRELPKGCVSQVKDDGRVKNRETVDGGARRARRLQMQRDRLDSLVEQIDELQSKGKGKPGADSPNGSMRLDELAQFKWGSVNDFGEQCDVLAASGEPVDLLLFDFEGYYQQFPRAETEWWWHEEVVSSAGASIATRGSFGMGDLPNYTNRWNFAVLQLIRVELRKEQAAFPVEQVPDGVRHWMAERAEAGLSTDWTADMAFFDDDTFACLSMGGQWTDIVERVAVETWAKYKMDLSKDKTKRIPYGSEVVDPVLGVIVDVKRRQRRLPEPKQRRYSQNVDEIIELAESTQRNLVPKVDMQQVLGRLLFAMQAGIPTMWGDFVVLLAKLATNWSTTFLRLHPEAVDTLRHMQWRLQHENGTSLTPYQARPGRDGRPVLISYSDAGLRGKSPTVTRAGYGGFVFVQGSLDVYFYHGQWDAEQVMEGQLDINDLETLASGYAADVADKLAERLPGTGSHYLYSIGDSAVHFAHVMVRDKMSSAGLRYLYRERSMKDRERNRLTCTLHVTREWNRASDALANGDLAVFEREVRWLLGPDVQLHELQPPNVSVSGLVAFKCAVARR